MSLIGTAEYPANFSAASLGSAMVPLYMRLREHHCISPQTPAATGGKNDGFDDGLFNAYFPPMHSQESDGSVNVTDSKGNQAYYETFVPDHPNSHNVDTCEMCSRANEEKDREIRMKLRSPNYNIESEFESMGLGAGSDEDGDNSSDDQSDDNAFGPCDGIQDIIVTGAVRCTFLGLSWPG
jgi:hypothetical protein